jgi:hypothetical protein
LHGSPIDQHVERRGYASAASGYRAKGYRPDWFLLDLLALKAAFRRAFRDTALDHSRPLPPGL